MPVGQNARYNFQEGDGDSGEGAGDQSQHVCRIAVSSANEQAEVLRDSVDDHEAELVAADGDGEEEVEGEPLRERRKQLRDEGLHGLDVGHHRRWQHADVEDHVAELTAHALLGLEPLLEADWMDVPDAPRAPAGTPPKVLRELKADPALHLRREQGTVLLPRGVPLREQCLHDRGEY